MELNRPPVIVIELNDGKEFESRCARLYADDYEMVSSNCGFVDSKEYDFCSIFQAIFKARALQASRG